MPFTVRKSSLNHSPQWYHDHCHAEDGGSPALRAMLLADMRFLDADNDSTRTYMEKIHDYETCWNQLLSRPNSGFSKAIGDAMEREAASGFTPKARFTQPPFSNLGKFLAKHDLTAADVRAYLTWSAKNENLKVARNSKKAAAKPNGARDRLGLLKKRARGVEGFG